MADLRRESRATADILGFLRAALVVVASVRIIRGLTDLVDAFTNVQNRIRLVTSSQEELIAVQETLFDVAQETRVGFEATVTLFQRITRATRGTGRSFQDLIDITRTVNQTIAIAGAESQEARNALIQFSQGLASGALRGDELRSVAEQLTPLLDIIGKEFGKTGAQLRALANAGDLVLDTETVLRALEKAAAETNAEFDKITPTIAAGLTQVGNAFVKFLGNLNRTTSFAGRLARGLKIVADNIDKVVLAVAAFVAVATLNLILAQFARLGSIVGTILIPVFGGLVQVVLASAAAFRALSAAVITNPLFVLGAAVVAIVGAAFVLMSIRVGGVTEALSRMGMALRDIAGLGVASVKTLIEAFKRLPGVARRVGTDIFNFLIGFVNDAVNGAIEILNKLPGVDIDFRATFEPLEQAGEETSESLLKFFLDTFFETTNAIDATVANGKAKFFEFKAFIEGLLADPVFDLSLLGNLPAGEDDALGGISASAKEATEDLRKLEAKFSDLVKVQIELAEAQKVINLAKEEEIEFLIKESRLLREVERDTLGFGISAESAADRIEALNNALDRGVISQEEFTVAARNTRLELLDQQRSLEAGIERTFLRLVDAATDGATQIEELFTSAFDAIEDAVVEFAQTGKFEFADFVRVVSEQLIRLGTQQALASAGGFFTNQFGLGGPSDTGFSPLGNVGSFLSGLLPFQDGGRFTVGSNTSVSRIPGVDNRLVAFRAQDGEQVTVTPRGEQPSGGAVTQVFNITTRDADSFERSRTQIQNRSAAALSRARSRR